jgi:DNA-binding MarR family transcriptional regulator
MPNGVRDFVEMNSLSCKFNLQDKLFIVYCTVMPPRNLDIAITDFTQSIGLLVRRARAAATSQELSWSEAGVLKRLAKDGPATTADLARAEGMRPQSMRPIIAALEKMGMIVRRPHATDGRQVNLELTARGAAVQKSAGEAKRTWVVQAIAQLNEHDREILFEAGRIMKRVAEGDLR